MSTKSYISLTRFDNSNYSVYFLKGGHQIMNLPTIIICVILVIIIYIGIRSTKKRATSGCCGSSETVKKVRVKDKNKDHYPYKTVLKVYDIHCQNCVHTIENAFNSQEGFYAKVNTEDNTVTILSKQEHSTDELIDIVTKAGYTSKAV